MKRTNITNYASCKAYDEHPNQKQFEKCINLLETLLEKHNRILVCRCTLWAGEPKLQGHKDIEKLLRLIKTKYKSDYYGFVWTFEISKEKREHYHLTIFLNANKYSSDFMALLPFMEKWKKLTKNKTWTSEYKSGANSVRSIGRIDRGDTTRFDEITHGLSYLCKTNQKIPKMKRAFSMTHLKSLVDGGNYRTKTTIKFDEAA